MLRTFIQVSALLLTFFAGILLVKGSFILSSKDIAWLSSTRYGYNSSLIKSLSGQQADTKIGVALLMLSAIVQLSNLLWPMRICDFEVSITGVILAFIFSSLLFVSALKLSHILSVKTQSEATNILEKKQNKNTQSQ